MEIVARFEGLGPLEKVLAGMLAHSGDLTDLMDRLGLTIETQTDERFDAEEAPDGSKWKQSWRAKQDGGKTLSASRRGRNSVTHRASADRVEVGTNVGYMAVHQTGATIRPKSAKALAFNFPGAGLVFAQKVVLPRREWLGVSPDNADELVDEAEDWFVATFPGIER